MFFLENLKVEWGRELHECCSISWYLNEPPLLDSEPQLE